MRCASAEQQEVKDGFCFLFILSDLVSAGFYRRLRTTAVYYPVFGFADAFPVLDRRGLSCRLIRDSI
jgi:hypothetical protein